MRFMMIVKAGIVLAMDGLHPPSMGARVTFAGEDFPPEFFQKG